MLPVFIFERFQMFDRHCLTIFDWMNLILENVRKLQVVVYTDTCLIVIFFKFECIVSKRISYKNILTCILSLLAIFDYQCLVT